MMTCDLAMTSEVHYHDQGQVNAAYHFKILVPSVAAGAIIGKGGETIAQLQKEAGARVKMSKATDFYPGTTERVCLITGSIDGILRIHEFIMEKIKEKPDPNAKMAIDFDHKQPAEREKQVKILVPNSTAGIIIGKGGSYIKEIKENSGAYVQISQKSKDHALAERCITVIGEMENNKTACRMILSKIVEDPQSGSCLTVSYADVTGPVANFNPTGSPFASTTCNAPTLNDSSYNGSNGSLNSPTSTFPQSHSEVIEAVRSLLRGSGYSEQALQDICAAMTTLAGYGLLAIGLSILNGIGQQDNSSNLFGPIGSLGSRSNPELSSPSSALPVNHNSFGLGTRPPQEDTAAIEVEVGENIVGAILGPGGKALVEIQRFSGANIQISKKGIFAPGTRNRIVVISGLSSAVSTAQYLIERQIQEEENKRAQQNALGVLR